MVSIKRQNNRGYILLEALIATALFALIVSLVLAEIQASRKRHYKYLQEAETYQLAKMAIQTGQAELNLNETTVQVHSTEKGLVIYHNGEVLVNVKEN